MPEILNTEQAAEYLLMSEAWVREHAIEMGAVKLGGKLRFEREKILEWFRQQGVVSQPTQFDATQWERRD